MNRAQRAAGMQRVGIDQSAYEAELSKIVRLPVKNRRQ